jgi:hypothetical protein
VAQILRWADQHFAATGEWPNTRSGTVTSAPGESWNRIDVALYVGNRGLPGGSSLAQLLQRRRRVRNPVRPPRLTAEQILKWADRHRKQTGTWPSQGSGPVADAPGEFWHLLDAALRLGLRGLQAGSSLARLLAEERGTRNRADLPPLTPTQICAWAERHRDRTGRWPSQGSGSVTDAPGESWAVINRSLRVGFRGLPGGDSLAKLLNRRFHRNFQQR